MRTATNVFGRSIHVRSSLQHPRSTHDDNNHGGNSHKVPVQLLEDDNDDERECIGGAGGGGRDSLGGQHRRSNNSSHAVDDVDDYDDATDEVCIPEQTWNDQGLFVFMVLEDSIMVQSQPTRSLLPAVKEGSCLGVVESINHNNNESSGWGDVTNTTRPSAEATRAEEPKRIIPRNELIAVDLIQHSLFSKQIIGGTNQWDHRMNNNDNNKNESTQLSPSNSNTWRWGKSSDSNNHYQVDCVRLADQSGWLPVQEFVGNHHRGLNNNKNNKPQEPCLGKQQDNVDDSDNDEKENMTAPVGVVQRLRQVAVERGMWTLYVDNVPHGQYLRRHPMMMMMMPTCDDGWNVVWERPYDSLLSSSSSSSSSTAWQAVDDGGDKVMLSSSMLSSSALPVLYEPMQKVFCDARVTHPISRIQFYHVQGSLSGWLLDHQPPTLHDPIPRSLLLTPDCIQLGVFCFRALCDLTIQSTPNTTNYAVLEHSDSFSHGSRTSSRRSSNRLQSSSKRRMIAQGQVVSVDVIRSSPEYDAVGDGPFLRLSDGSGWLFVHKNKRRVMTELDTVQQGWWQVKVLGRSRHDDDESRIVLQRHPCRRQLESSSSSQRNGSTTKLPEQNCSTQISFVPNTILQCDYKLVDYGDGRRTQSSTQMSGDRDNEGAKSFPITYYHVYNTHGWIMDRKPPSQNTRQGKQEEEGGGGERVLQVVSESPSMTDRLDGPSVGTTLPWTLDFLRGIAACHELREMSFQEFPQQVLILSSSKNNNNNTACGGGMYPSSSGDEGGNFTKQADAPGIAVTFHVFLETHSVSYLVHPSVRETGTRRRDRIEKSGSITTSTSRNHLSKHKKGTYKSNGMKLTQINGDDTDEEEENMSFLSHRDYFHCSQKDLLIAFQEGLAELTEHIVAQKKRQQDKKVAELDPILQARYVAKKSKTTTTTSNNPNPVVVQQPPREKKSSSNRILKYRNYPIRHDHGQDKNTKDEEDLGDFCPTTKSNRCDYGGDDNKTLVRVDKNDVHIAVIPLGSSESSMTIDENIESIWKPQRQEYQSQEKPQHSSTGKNTHHSSEVFTSSPQHYTNNKERLLAPAQSSSTEESTTDTEDVSLLIGDEREIDEESSASPPPETEEGKELNLRLQLQDCESEIHEMQEKHRRLLMSIHSYDVHRFQEAAQHKKLVRERRNEENLLLLTVVSTSSTPPEGEDRIRHSNSKPTTTTTTTQPVRLRRKSLGTPDRNRSRSRNHEVGVTSLPSPPDRMLSTNKNSPRLGTPPRLVKRNSETSLAHRVLATSSSTSSNYCEGRRRSTGTSTAAKTKGSAVSRVNVVRSSLEDGGSDSMGNNSSRRHLPPPQTDYLQFSRKQLPSATSFAGTVLTATSTGSSSSNSWSKTHSTKNLIRNTVFSSSEASVSGTADNRVYYFDSSTTISTSDDKHHRTVTDTHHINKNKTHTYSCNVYDQEFDGPLRYNNNTDEPASSNKQQYHRFTRRTCCDLVLSPSTSSTRVLDPLERKRGEHHGFLNNDDDDDNNGQDGDHIFTTGSRTDDDDGGDHFFNTASSSDDNDSA